MGPRVGLGIRVSWFRVCLGQLQTNLCARFKNTTCSDTVTLATTQFPSRARQRPRERERLREKEREREEGIIYYGLSVWVIDVRSSLPAQPDQKDRVGILPGDGDTSPCPGESERERGRKGGSNGTRL